MRLGVIGVGRFGAVHARVWAAMPGVDLVGVQDLAVERASHVADEIGVTAFPDLDDMLERVDAVSIAVPYACHRELAESALRRGRHVLLEKPFTTRASDALDLRRIALEAGRVAYAGYIEREIADVAAIAAGIDVHLYEACRLTPGLLPGQDEILELMVHDLHHALRLFQPRAATVSVRVPSPSRSDVDLHFAPFGTARLSAGKGGSVRVMRFDGAAGSATLDLSSEAIRAQNPLRRQFERFLEIVRSGHSAEHDDLAVPVLRLAEAAIEARRTGRTVHVAL